jgi:uncharacterized protein YbjT (DUF2867 family)
VGKRQDVSRGRSPRFCVTGASGVVGRHVADGLRKRDVAVRVATRTPTSDDEVRFAFGDASTYDLALDGVDRVFLIRPANVTRVERDVVPFVERLSSHGIERVAYASVLDAESVLLLPHARIEAALNGEPVEAVHLRPSWFMQNLTTYHRPELWGGELFVPAGAASVVPVDTRDVARAAIEVFSGEGPFRDGYTVTGPARLDFETMAERLSEVLGHRIRYTSPSLLRVAVHLLRVRGVNPGFVLAVSGIYLTARLGAVGDVSDYYRELTGEAPTDFVTFGMDHADAWA